MSTPMHVAIDLGAGSGRALVGGPAGGRFRVEEVHRFHYAPRPSAGRLRWDAARLLEGIREGLRRSWSAAGRGGSAVASVGVDSWGVDYALLDRAGALVEDPVCYRDERTAGEMDRVFAAVPREEIYARTGIQYMPFNTLFQLAAHVREGLPDRAAHVLLVPDFCHHHLCGSLACERTDASTTQLLGARSHDWDAGLFTRLRLPRALMPELVDAGARLGTIRGDLCAELGITPTAVVAPATHDTASAVAGTPLERGWAYISSGTWSLVGVERREPLLSEDALQAGLTNELGAGRTVRLLTNVMGLWLLESCRREWEAGGRPRQIEPLLAAVARLDAPARLVDPDDRRFFAPASMVSELRGALRDAGQPDTDDPVALAKTILDSLARRYADVVARIERLTGDVVPGIHIVGGGSLNAYLNQATADASGRPVVAGPVEATAIGNLLVQGMAAGEIGSIEEGRRLVAASFRPARYEPRA